MITSGFKATLALQEEISSRHDIFDSSVHPWMDFHKLIHGANRFLSWLFTHHLLYYFVQSAFCTAFIISWSSFFPLWATSLTLVLVLLWGHSLARHCSQLDVTALELLGASKPVCLNCEINDWSGEKNEQKRQNRFECISKWTQSVFSWVNSYVNS